MSKDQPEPANPGRRSLSPPPLQRPQGARPLAVRRTGAPPHTVPRAERWRGGQGEVCLPRRRAPAAPPRAYPLEESRTMTAPTSANPCWPPPPPGHAVDAPGETIIEPAPDTEDTDTGSSSRRFRHPLIAVGRIRHLPAPRPLDGDPLPPASGDNASRSASPPSASRSPSSSSPSPPTPATPTDPTSATVHPSSPASTPAPPRRRPPPSAQPTTRPPSRPPHRPPRPPSPRVGGGTASPFVLSERQRVEGHERTDPVLSVHP